MARLGDIATYVNGYAFKPEDWSTEGLPIIRIQDLTGNSYQMNRFNGTCQEKYIVNPGDVLISWSASLGVYMWKGEQAILNQHIFKVVFDKAEVDTSFFVHQVASILEKASNQAHGATMKHLTKPIFDALPFYLPELPTQRRISATLDKVSDGITVCRQMLADLDLLVKSQFIEMFGDPVKNEMLWQTKSLEEACRIIVDCPHSTPNYTTENTGFMCIRTSIVKKNRILWDEIEYISEDEYNKRIQRKRPEKGDVVYTREGAILGIAAVIDRDCNVALGQRSMLLSPNTELCTSEFLSVAMNCDSFLENALKGQSGSASPHINVGDIKAFKMIMPPVEQQRRFSAFIQQADKSKFVVQQQLSELETLKKSLMQQYFGQGESA